jgi:hypothetical protein
MKATIRVVRLMSYSDPVFLLIMLTAGQSSFSRLTTFPPAAWAKFISRLLTDLIT